MKALKLLLLFILCIGLSNCRKDDDDPIKVPEKGFFAKEIIISTPSSPTEEVKANFTYDTNNRLKEIVLEATSLPTESVEFVYNDEGLVTEMSGLSLGNTVLEYENKRLKKVTSGSDVHNFTYTDGTYESDTGLKFVLDEKHQVIESGQEKFEYVNNVGVHEHLVLQPAYFLINNRITLLNSNQEISKATYFNPSPIVFNVETQRNENHKISKMIYTEESSGTQYLVFDITYEERILNP